MSINTLYLGKHVRVIGDAVNMGSAEVNMTSALVSVAEPVLSAHAVTKNYVDEKIANMLANTDSSAIDSFSEVVAAFQAADSNLSGTITALSNSASSGLNAEISRAEQAELVLRTDLASEVSRATAAEGVIIVGI